MQTDNLKEICKHFALEKTNLISFCIVFLCKIFFFLGWVLSLFCHLVSQSQMLKVLGLGIPGSIQPKPIRTDQR